MKADLAMAIHFHQPVGNFDHVIERACDKCYIPFVETLRDYPAIRMSFHFTGCLLEWAEAKRPELLAMVKDMANTGQIELMTGGFYEPILASIPPEDRQSQIKMLTEYVKRKFSYDARGAWVAERVWEPGLASDLEKAGVKYIILDDTHFLYAGVPKDRTYGYYITEDNGNTVAVFPSDKVLRYHIPFKMPNECTAYMKHVAEREGDPLFVYGDDGEKFGEWPGTHKWVFQEKWLEKFFDELMQNSHWINTMPLSEAFDKRRPLGRVYFPTTSYEEMLEWALPADMQEYMEDVLKDVKNSCKEEFYKPFMRGGFWRNFFSKYPESNFMNKRMLHVSRKLRKALADDGTKADKKILEEASKDLFRGQCNCAYWHGVFGGLYLYHLRRAIYHHLIKCEAAIDKVKYGKKDACWADITDIDADGRDEIVAENREIALYIDPADGGTIKELDSKVTHQNLTNTLSRRKEAYHRKIIEKLSQQQKGGTGGVKTIHDGIQEVDAGVGENLTYDRYSRCSLIDHFLAADTDIKWFSKCEYREAGDFLQRAYEFDLEKSAKEIRLNMKREGHVDGARVEVVKEITLPKKGSYFTVRYRLINVSGGGIKVRFAPEFNVTMPDCDSDRYSIITDVKKKGKELSEVAVFESVKKVEVKDSAKKLSWVLWVPEKSTVWHFPVKTVSQSEKAYELNYQSSAIMPVFAFDLAAGADRDITLKVQLVHEN